MTLIRRPNPFGELLSLHQAMDRLFGDSVVLPYGAGGSENNELALDVYTTPDSLVVEAALPGVRPDDVEITVLGEVLTISAETASDQTSDEDGYTHREIRRGSFTRTVTLPGGLKPDSATATYENGLLRLTFPKAEAATPRQITIKATADVQASPAAPADLADAAPTEQPTEQPTDQPTDRPATEWQSNNDWSSTAHGGDQAQAEAPVSEWKSTSEWQNGDQWQSDGQGNGQPRVEQAS